MPPAYSNPTRYNWRVPLYYNQQYTRGGNNIDKGSLKHLKDLRDQVSRHRILEEGSDEVVIYAAEFQALEEAIKELEEKE